MTDLQKQSTASGEYRYWAFISYSSKDAAWGRWLHRAIESYGIPAQLINHPTPSGHPAPKRFRPLFRDRDELPASADLGVQIEAALRASRYLIVVCSRHAAKSKWVNKEIETFQKMDRRGRVLAIIIDGEPNAGGKRECFPPALRASEPIAADARPEGDGQSNAKLKLLAGMLGVSLDSLKQRDAHRRIRRLQAMVAATLTVALGFGGLAGYAYYQKSKAVRARQQAESILEFLLYEMRDALQPIGRLDLVEKIQKRVEEYHRDLGVDKSQPVTAHNRAAALSNQGNIELARGDLAGARVSFEQSKMIFEKLAASDPGNATWQRDLSVSFDRLGEVQVAQGDLAGARGSLEQGQKISQKLVTRDPGNTGWQRDLSLSFEKLGEVQLAQGDLIGARVSFQQCQRIRQDLAASDPNSAGWKRDLGVSFGKLGDVQQAQADLAGARVSFEQGRKIFQKLAASDPSNATWQRELGVSFIKLGDMQWAQGDLGDARRSFEQALEITQKLAADDPSNTTLQREMSVDSSRLGVIQLGQGDLAGARISFKQSLEIFQRLTARDPSNTGWQRDLSVSFGEMGDLQVAQGDLAGARSSFEQALAIAQKLAASDPSNANWQRDLVVSQMKMAELSAKFGTGEALEWCVKAYEQLSVMKQRGITLPTDEERFQQLKRTIGK